MQSSLFQDSQNLHQTKKQSLRIKNQQAVKENFVQNYADYHSSGGKSAEHQQFSTSTISSKFLLSSQKNQQKQSPLQNSKSSSKVLNSSSKKIKKQKNRFQLVHKLPGQKHQAKLQNAGQKTPTAKGEKKPKPTTTLAKQPAQGKQMMICPFWNDAQMTQQNQKYSRAQGECGCFQFYSLNSLLKHLSRHMNPMTCTICENEPDSDKISRFMTVRDLKRHYKMEHGQPNHPIKTRELTAYELRLFKQKYIVQFESGNMIYKVSEKTDQHSHGSTYLDHGITDYSTPALAMTKALKIKLKHVKLVNGVWQAMQNEQQKNQDMSNADQESDKSGEILGDDDDEDDIESEEKVKLNVHQDDIENGHDSCNSSKQIQEKKAIDNPDPSEDFIPLQNEPVNDDQPKFVCPLPGCSSKIFRSKLGYRKHMELHENPYRCVTCQKGFHSKFKYNRHLKEEVCVVQKDSAIIVLDGSNTGSQSKLIEKGQIQYITLEDWPQLSNQKSSIHHYSDNSCQKQDLDQPQPTLKILSDDKPGESRQPLPSYIQELKQKAREDEEKVWMESKTQNKNDSVFPRIESNPILSRLLQFTTNIVAEQDVRQYFQILSQYGNHYKPNIMQDESLNPVDKYTNLIVSCLLEQNQNENELARGIDQKTQFKKMVNLLRMQVDYALKLAKLKAV